MFDDGNKQRCANDEINAPHLDPVDPLDAVRWDRLARAQRFREQAHELLNTALLLVECTKDTFERDPLDIETFRTGSEAFVETWNDAMRHREAFIALISAQGSA